MKLGTDANVAVADGTTVRYTSVVNGTPTACGFTEPLERCVEAGATFLSACGTVTPAGTVVCKVAAIVEALPAESGA